MRVLSVPSVPSRRRKHPWPLIAALAIALAPFVFPAPASAASFTVTKTADTNDGVCDADCSLREAISAANAAAGADTITVPAGTYQLTLGNAGGANEDPTPRATWTSTAL